MPRTLSLETPREEERRRLLICPITPIAFVAIAGGDISQRRSIQIRNMKPSATASPGVLYRDTYYMSGKSGFIPDQGIVTQDIKLQLRQTMRNLLDDLQGLDLDFGDVVEASFCLREMKYAEDLVPLYETFFKGRFPAQSLMQNSFDLKTATGEQISFIAIRHSVNLGAVRTRLTRSSSVTVAKIFPERRHSKHSSVVAATSRGEREDKTL
jgi:2-iminobutanoate/2-iminopropanoate deaminase